MDKKNDDYASKQYNEEVLRRWGNTDAFKQSTERVKKMTKAEMEKVKKEGEMLTQKIADNMAKGIGDKEVQKLISQHYNGIQFFYDCPLEMYRQLGAMYIDDPRFTKYYDKYNPGLAKFMDDAIAYFCDHKK